MAGKQKLKKFAEVTAFPNVLEAFNYDDDYLHVSADEKVFMKGKWATDFFRNNRSVCLELACGKGEYTLGLAKLYPQKNFIGMDIKGNRIWQGARQALEAEMENVGFLRSRIECMDIYFSRNEITDIWIVFPDPFPKSKDENNRLTSPIFLDRYAGVMQEGCFLHLKTDSQKLYEYTLDSLDQHVHFNSIFKDPDIDCRPRSLELDIMTYYERLHLQEGKKIKYIRAQYKKQQKQPEQ